MSMTRDGSVVARLAIAIALSVVSVCVIGYGLYGAIQMVAVPLDRCIDLDAGGRFAYFVAWLELSFLSGLVIALVTIPLAYFGWWHLGVCWLLCGVGVLAMITTFVGDMASDYSSGCPIPLEWPGWLVDRINGPAIDWYRGFLWLAATVLIGLTLIIASAWELGTRAFGK